MLSCPIVKILIFQASKREIWEAIADNGWSYLSGFAKMFIGMRDWERIGVLREHWSGFRIPLATASPSWVRDPSLSENQGHTILPLDRIKRAVTTFGFHKQSIIEFPGYFSQFSRRWSENGIELYEKVIACSIGSGSARLESRKSGYKQF
jgi:hypothetical protein